MNSQLLDAAGPKFSQWQRSIVFDQGRHGKPNKQNRTVWEPIRERQDELQSAIKAGNASLGAYLRKALHIGREKIGAPEFPRDQLTPDEFRIPPVELEHELWTAWTGVRPRLASRPVFWLLCHIEWIEQGRFGQAGHRLEDALVGGQGRGLEAETRNFLRRTGGIPHERGKISVFSDCPLARAWWRVHVAEQVARVPGADMSTQEAHAVLHANRQAWETLAMLGVKRVTIISQPTARAVVVRRLKSILRENGRLHRQDVQEVATDLARLGLRQSLEHTPWERLVA